MRAILLTLLLAIHFLCHGQTELDKKYSGDLCACLNSLHIVNITDSDELYISDCADKAMQQNRALIAQSAIKQYGDSSGENINKLAQDLQDRAYLSLVRDCKLYSTIMDSLRYLNYWGLNQDSLNSLLNAMNREGDEKRDMGFYYSRSQLYLELKMYDSSLNDAEKALQINANYSYALYNKAWIEEIKGNYDQAILLYDRVAELTHAKYFYIYAEIAKRKKSGL